MIFRKKRDILLSAAGNVTENVSGNLFTAYCRRGAKTSVQFYVFMPFFQYILFNVKTRRILALRNRAYCRKAAGITGKESALTIKDIARLSGYGVSTVSRALNGHPDINEATRKKIQEVAERYNFVPNANARRLKASSSKSVAIIVKGTFNVFFSGLIENMQAEIDRSGYNVQVHYMDTRLNEVELAQRVLQIEKPIGIIFLGGSIINFTEDFETLIPVPCVLCSTSASSCSFSNLSSVSVDDFSAGRGAIDYLISQGHRKIGIIGGDKKSFCASGQRYSGCMESFRNHKLDFSDDAFEMSDFDPESAYSAAQRLIKRKKELTAVFAMSDTIAIGAIRGLADMGLKVPEDISVIGFDGISFSSYYNPRITTFRQPQERIAGITVSLLKNMLQNSNRHEHILLKAEFQPGGSVKPIENGQV